MHIPVKKTPDPEVHTSTALQPLSGQALRLSTASFQRHLLQRRAAACRVCSSSSALVCESAGPAKDMATSSKLSDSQSNAVCGVSLAAQAPQSPPPLRVAVVCSSNQNRSMEAHSILSKRGFLVRSFGTGSMVKLPGPTPDQPNVYDFKTTYEQMYQDLCGKDEGLYTQNGILNMLNRNKRIKPRPERFQNCTDAFDLIFTCEERVYDQVLQDLNSREQETYQPVHVVNVDIPDNMEEATLGAFLICEICQCIQHADDIDGEIDELLLEFEEKLGRPFLHTVCFY